MKTLLSCLLSVLASLACLQAAPKDWMPQEQDDTQLWWQDGPPRILSIKEPPPSAVLCIKHGSELLRFDTQTMKPLDGEWECSLQHEGKTYHCTGHSTPADTFLQPVRFVESGRYFQRVVIEGLTFADAERRQWSGQARLEITAWPDRIAFRLESDPEVSLTLRWGAMKAAGTGSVFIGKGCGMPEAVVESELPVVVDPVLACHRLALPEKAWSNPGRTFYPSGELDRTDRWKFTLRNDSEKEAVARVMFTQEKHLPITGFTPMLCDDQGRPTGILVQLSKNWHRSEAKGSILHEGPWFHGFAWVRVPPRSRREFTLQMVYARYGGVYAASLAQLCLIGWGHNQFWDQAAIGSFGESICFEPGRVQRRCFITDVRPLLTLTHEKDCKPWGWAENCGGGDLLMWKGTDGAWQPFHGTRVDYRSHGPCLTHASYQEDSAGGEISCRTQVSLPRSNDHLRVFFHLRYDVHKPLHWQRLAFFQLGADFYNDTPARLAAVGDARDMKDEWRPKFAKDEFDRQCMPLKGEQPWISMHGVEPEARPHTPAMASRGLIVRSWKAVLGSAAAGPHASFFCTEWGKGNHRTVAELSPPPEVHELLPGDYVEADLEFIVLPADASAYYGTDAPLKEALSQDANTWRLVQREAAGNALRAHVASGTLTNTYPVRVAVAADQSAELTLRGGLGHLPVTFTGLSSPDAHQLLVNGMPDTFWQTDWDAASQSWQMTFNVPAEGTQPVHLSFGKKN
ncbi:hypothetical protein [Prosthecobacter vanneervenii]|uniref:Uncharacterized protein n=1 Tax=Prosthecobacter vanneervenii TaxID=48466 RepID=A0A7W8DIC8_9BACT|nr:hypothetical protein [Prosthecobacter vanneervenii]MBB5030887.1 hypothetical protein [Prosthecobacter vanneervenii]